MFSPGEYVVYGVEGVCRVEEAGRLAVPGLDRDRDYYRLRPHFRGGTIYAPVDGKIVPRPVLTLPELERHLSRLDTLDPLEDIPGDGKLAGAYYRSLLMENAFPRLLQLCKSLSKKQSALSRQRRNVNSTDLRSWRAAEELLTAEIAFVLGIPPTEAKKYISNL